MNNNEQVNWYQINDPIFKFFSPRTTKFWINNDFSKEEVELWLKTLINYFDDSYLSSTFDLVYWLKNEVELTPFDLTNFSVEEVRSLFGQHQEWIKNYFWCDECGKRIKKEKTFFSKREENIDFCSNECLLNWEKKNGEESKFNQNEKRKDFGKLNRVSCDSCYEWYDLNSMFFIDGENEIFYCSEICQLNKSNKNIKVVEERKDQLASNFNIFSAKKWLDQKFPNQWERKYVKEIHINEQLEGELDLGDFAFKTFKRLFSNDLKIYLYPHINNNNLKIVNQMESAEVIQLQEVQPWLEKNYPKNGVCPIVDSKGWENVPSNKGKKRIEINRLMLSQKNLIGTLDLSDFVNLEELECWGNWLTHLILPKSDKLKILGCSKNQLTSLDLSNYVNLEHLSCFRNQLAQITLPSSNQLLEIAISNNLLASFDYSVLNPASLTDLRLFNNDLPATDIAVFSHLINLTVLSISNNDDQIEKKKSNKFYGSLESLKNLTSLKNLEIDRNIGIDKGLEFLSDNLEIFNCQGTKLEDELKKQKWLWEINVTNDVLLKRWKKNNRIAVIGKEDFSKVDGGMYEMTEVSPNKILTYLDIKKEKKHQRGVCPECGKIYEEDINFNFWSLIFDEKFLLCDDCIKKRDRINFDDWTSGNELVDSFIQKNQLTYARKSIKWIPYEEFKNLVFIGRGGFGTVYKAESYFFKNIGKRNKFILESAIDIIDSFGEFQEDNKFFLLALKVFDNSSKMNIDEFLQEVHNSWFLDNTISLLEYKYDKIFDKRLAIPFYGVSQNPDGNYILISKYMRGGDLHKNLDSIYENKKNEKPGNFIVFFFESFSKSIFSEEGILFIKGYFEKYSWIFTICEKIELLHQKGIIHRDLHPGNILFSKEMDFMFPHIIDFGLCCPINEVKSGKLYGNLPYVAPELIKGEFHSFASDIYALGMIIYEILSETSPFYEFDLNNMSDREKLIEEIVKGLRPEFPQEQGLFGHKVDDFFEDLIKKCWDKDPKKRPNINEIVSELKNFKKNVLFSLKHNSKITKYTKETNFSLNRSKRRKSHSQLIDSAELFKKFQTQTLENNVVDYSNKMIEFKEKLTEIKKQFSEEINSLINQFIKLTFQLKKVETEDEELIDSIEEVEKKLKKHKVDRQTISKLEDLCKNLFNLEIINEESEFQFLIEV